MSNLLQILLSSHFWIYPGAVFFLTVIAFFFVRWALKTLNAAEGAIYFFSRITAAIGLCATLLTFILTLILFTAKA